QAGDDSELIERLNAVLNGSAAPSVAPAAVPVVMAEPVPDEHGFVPVPAAVTEALATVEAPVAPVVSAAPVAKPAAETAPAAAPAVAANQSVRVSISLLETLMTAVSELVLTRNQLVQGIRDLEIGSVKVPLQRLSQIVSELQEGVMKTRMQQIGNA